MDSVRFDDTGYMLTTSIRMEAHSHFGLLKMLLLTVNAIYDQMMMANAVMMAYCWHKLLQHN